VIFHKHVLSRLITNKCDACLAIDLRRVGKEEVKVLLTSDRVKAIGKHLEPRKTQGEFIGIARFSQKFNVAFREKLNEIVEEGKINTFFEEALDRIVSHSDFCSVCAVNVSDLPSLEIDTIQDYKAAMEIYKRIVISV
jgi:choline kinase